MSIPALATQVYAKQTGIMCLEKFVLLVNHPVQHAQELQRIAYLAYQDIFSIKKIALLNAPIKLIG